MNNQRGAALLLVLITMAVLSILGAAFLNVSLAENNFAAISEIRMQSQYIARSGVEVGYNKLIAASITNSDLDDLITDANDLSNLNNQILGVGKYSIQYEAYPADSPAYIKIRSTSTTTNNRIVTDQVTLLVPLSSGPTAWTSAPDTWLRAKNLHEGVSPTITDAHDEDRDDFQGVAIQFSDTPSQSPQNSSNGSIFRATVIQFSGVKNDVTFIQRQNTNAITFDAEVILFNGIVELNDDAPFVFSISPAIMNNNDLEPWTSSIVAGFENENRYVEYVYGDTYDSATDDMSYFEATIFEPGTHYGLVYFAGDVEPDGFSNATEISSGWYYFPNDVNINTHSGVDELIPIDDFDPIIDATLRRTSGDYKVLPHKELYGNE